MMCGSNTELFGYNKQKPKNFILPFQAYLQAGQVALGKTNPDLTS